jgi:hypothetical protein
VYLLGILSYVAIAAYIHIVRLAVPYMGAAISMPPIKGGDAWL